jgi:hypothetical protein
MTSKFITIIVICYKEKPLVAMVEEDQQFILLLGVQSLTSELIDAHMLRSILMITTLSSIADTEAEKIALIILFIKEIKME